MGWSFDVQAMDLSPSACRVFSVQGVSLRGGGLFHTQAAAAVADLDVFSAQITRQNPKILEGPEERRGGDGTARSVEDNHMSSVRPLPLPVLRPGVAAGYRTATAAWSGACCDSPCKTVVIAGRAPSLPIMPIVHADTTSCQGFATSNY